MREIVLDLDEKSYRGACPPGRTLHEFLTELGCAVPQILLDQKGRRVVPLYTMAHTQDGCSLTSLGELPLESPASTPEQILTAGIS